MPQGYVFFYEEEEITGQAFRTNNGYSYPSNWCFNASIQQLKRIGVVSLLEVWPPLEEGNYYDDTYIDNFENLTRTYNQSIIE